MDKSGYPIFQQESPEIAAAFNKLIEAIAKPSALDHKTKHLIYVAMKIVTGDQGAALVHVPLVKKLGASRENCGNRPVNHHGRWFERHKHGFSGRSGNLRQNLKSLIQMSVY